MMIVASGERSSWETVARNWSFARVAASAVSRASSSSRRNRVSAKRCSHAERNVRHVPSAIAHESTEPITIAVPSSIAGTVNVKNGIATSHGTTVPIHTSICARHPHAKNSAVAR